VHRTRGAQLHAPTRAGKVQDADATTPAAEPTSGVSPTQGDEQHHHAPHCGGKFIPGCTRSYYEINKLSW